MQVLNVVHLSDCKLIRLAPDTIIKPFDCNDADLNEFLFQDAKNFLSELLAVTYLYEYGAEIVAFFSVSNDKIFYDTESLSRNAWKRFRGLFPEKKKLKGYPAVKIGRFGVTQKYKRMKIGTELLDSIKMSFLSNNKTGCRFITVDAYNNPDTISFYTRNSFVFLTGNDYAMKTRLMYFDLCRFAPYVQGAGA